MSGIRIKVLKDGPVLVSGAAMELVDPQGNTIAIAEDKTVALCRCGASANKPYCDGSHKGCGFKGDEAAAQP